MEAIATKKGHTMNSLLIWIESDVLGCAKFWIPCPLESRHLWTEIKTNQRVSFKGMSRFPTKCSEEALCGCQRPSVLSLLSMSSSRSHGPKLEMLPRRPTAVDACTAAPRCLAAPCLQARLDSIDSWRIGHSSSPAGFSKRGAWAAAEKSNYSFLSW